MTDLTEPCKQAIIAEAHRQENEKAHYVKRGYGHRYDVAGHPMGGLILRPSTCQFIGAAGPGSALTSQGVPSMVRFAVTSSLGGRRVCAGRCADPPSLPVGNPDGRPIVPNALAHPTLYAWRRPKNLPHERRIVVGECCAKRRHFDCLGFVTWCLWKALSPHFPSCLATYEVRHYYDLPTITRTQRLNRRTEPLLPGDLCFDTHLEHIGIAVSATEIAHSAGHRWGVKRTLINGPIFPASPGSPAGGAWQPEFVRLTQEILERLRRWHGSAPAP